MICVLEVIEGPACGKRLWLKEKQSLEVGRVSTADFSIPSDSHMSRRHLMFESSPNGFRVRDVGSSNGTYVNNVRISAIELQTGDIVRAGSTVLSVSLRNDGENPHDRDGLSFNQSSTFQASGPSITEREGNGTIRSMEGLEKFDLETTVRIPANPTQTVVLSSQSVVQDHFPTELGRSVGWKNYFQPTAVTGVYEQFRTFEGAKGNLVNLVQEFAQEFKIVAMVNQSQLDPDGVAFLQKWFEFGCVETFSWSLCLVRLGDQPELLELVKHCEGRDAFVILGGKKKLELADLKPFANSLSYPSMFSKHIFDQDASLKKTLLKDGIFAMSEIDLDGKIRLVISE